MDIQTLATPCNTPLISVVMSSLNHAAYVREAIESVLAQTYRNLELIIVDDGSEDGSLDIIGKYFDEFADPRARLIQQTRLGQAVAWCTALEAANGEYVAFLDSDDLWLPRKLEYMVAFARQIPGGGVYQHQVKAGDRGVCRPQLLSDDVFARWRELRTVNLALHKSLVAPFVPSSGLFFHREVLQKVLPIPPELVCCADAYLTRTCCTFGPLYSHPAILAVWRDHGENASRNGRFSFKRFWLPTIMPILNAWFARQGLDIRFVYRPIEAVWHPWTSLLAKLMTRARK